jgi:hypothetical protein
MKRNAMRKAQAGLKIDTLAGLANLVNAVQNDFHYMHFKAADRQGENAGGVPLPAGVGHWDTLHEILGDYYDELAEDYDTIAELALQVGESVNNPNESVAALPGYNTVEQFFNDGFKYDEALIFIEGKLGVLCDAAAAVNQRYGDGADGLAIQNFIGDFLQRWTKERNYKTARRLGGNIKKSQSGEGDDGKLEHFRKLIMEHLDILDDEDDDDVMAKAKAAQIGEVRPRKGGRYRKIGPNKWARVYDSHTRGAKMAIAALKRKVSDCKDAHEMMQLILQHRDRFSDKNGHPLPFVQELSTYVSQQQGKFESGKNPKAAKEATPKKDESGKKEKGKKEWKNPIEGLPGIDHVPPTMVAKTAANIFDHRAKETPEGKSRRHEVLSEDGWSDEAIEAFENYIAKMTPAEAKKAKKWADENYDQKAIDAYHKGKAERRMKKKDTQIAAKKEGEEKFEKIPIGKVEKWLIDEAKEVGLDIDGYDHEITNHFVNHVMNEHGDERTEKSRGNIAIKESDFNLIPEILKSPDFTIVGAKRGDQNIIIHSKKMDDGTTIYFEEVLSGEKNKTLRGKTMYKRISTDIDEDKLKSIVTMNEKTDLSKTKVVVGGGSQTPSGANENTDPTVAISANPADTSNITQSGKKSSADEERELSEEEKRRNRSEAMKGNKNAYKGGPEDEPKEPDTTPKPETEAERKAEEEDATKARARAGMPQVEKHGRSSSMKDSTWDPKSKDYRFRDTGYIAGSRKELAQSYIRNMAKSGSQVTNESIDWTGIEENSVAAAEIITKQNLMGKPNWEELQANGLSGGAGYLINEIYKTIKSKPETETADGRFNFSRGLDAIRGRLESCKNIDEIIAAIGEINGEITGNYLSAKQTSEYLALSEKQIALGNKMKSYHEKIREKVYEQGDPFAEARGWFEKQMPLGTSIDKLIDPSTGEWNGRVYTKNEHKQVEILRKCQDIFKQRQAAIEERSGIKYEDMVHELNDIANKMRQVKEAKNKELEETNGMKSVWETFGKSFKKALTVLSKAWKDPAGKWHPKYNGETFAKHLTKSCELAADDYSWTENKSTGGGGPRKTQFELKVADHIIRKGGRDAKVESTEDLKNMYNLRDVQSGNWVLNDVKSAKFHVENIAMGLADLADITGIPDNLVSLNGRLAIAIGARGHSKALAHYEPVERVINITKMKGGGSLGHEWFHAFDNLIADAMTGGRYNVFLTETGRYDNLTSRQKKLLDNVLTYKRWMDNARDESTKERYKGYYEDAKKTAKKAGIKIDEIEASENHIATVKNAFSKLVDAMMTGTATRTTDIFYTKDDHAYINSDEGKRMLRDIGIDKESYSFEDAIEKVSRYRIYRKKPEQTKRFLAAYYSDDSNGGYMSAKTKDTTSHFYESAKKLETGPGKPYWSSILEMGARAFSAYLNDKMAERGWENNYLAHATDNTSYDNHSPYPAGEERTAINAAFDELFKAINETGAIRKAIDRENALRVSPEKAGIIDAAVDGAMRFFVGLKRGRGSFERKKVVLNRAGDNIEAYRYIAQGEGIGEEPQRPDDGTGDILHGGEKTIAIDFDGVINSYTSGWQEPNETDEPVLNGLLK